MIQKQKLCVCGFVGRQKSVLSHLRICPVIVFHFIDQDDNTMTNSVASCSVAFIMTT